MDLCSYISGVLHEVYDDFDKNLLQLDQFCELHDLNYISNNIPDYKSPSIQDLYLLKYFPAYLFEYYLMYQDIYENIALASYNILSIGAGSGIDYIGARFALNEISPQKIISYNGIDLVDWRTFGKLETNPNDIYEIKINKCITIPSKTNIIVFPKSIGEFSDDDWKKLNDNFKLTRFDNLKIALAASMRENSLDNDSIRLKEIETIFHEKKFTTSMEIPYINKNKGFASFFSDFSYPEEIISYIKSIPTLCKHINCPSQLPNYCIHEDKITRMPILKDNHIRYNVIFLERD